MLPLYLSRAPSRTTFTHGPLPAYVDPLQPPQKRAPFASLAALKWINTAQLVLPASLRDAVITELDAKGPLLRYAKVLLPLRELLRGDFFTVYVKRGDISMLSEGRLGIDNVFSLHHGKLTMNLDRPTYETLGLVGKPIPDHGVKHQKNRYLIEIDLRPPSMLHGKKGFERIVWAFEKVLTQTLTWVFFDPETSDLTSSKAPIDEHHPRWFTAVPEERQISDVSVPALSDEYFKDKEYAAEVEEWLGLIVLQSPRVKITDVVDPYICRYSLPEHDDALEPTHVDKILRLQWSGFLTSRAVLMIFLATRKTLKEAGRVPDSSWAAMILHGFQGETLTIMILPGAETFLEWNHPQNHYQLL